MEDHIPNESLTLRQIPLPNAPYAKISKFALTFSAYEYWGGLKKVADIANRQGIMT
jgi:hypothetical protein